jgi:histidinol-phosphate aminotransferase
MKTDLHPRPVLAPMLSGMVPYRVPAHPAPVELRLASNEGPSLPAELRGFDDPTGETLRCYPSGRELEDEIARRLGLDADRILLTAGADDALLRAIRLVAAPGREIVLPTPTFEMIERTIHLMGARSRSVRWWRQALPVEEMLATVGPETAAVVLVNPNNPTGAAASPDEIECLLAGLGDRLLIVDQAYGEFADEDATPILLRAPNVVVIRTLSKAYGLAGLRIGIAIGSPVLVDWMRTVGHPYPVAGPSLAIARKVFGDAGAWQERYLTQVRHERNELIALLKAQGQRPLPSQANFVLCEFDDAHWVADALAGLGIAVRRFPDRPRLEASLRISCPGAKDAFDRLEHGVRTVLHPQALLFDLDGVLADVTRSYRQAIRQTADRFGVEVTPEQIDAAKAAGDANNDWVLTWRLVCAQRPGVELAEIRRTFERLYQGEAGQPGLWEDERLLIARQQLVELAGRLPLAIVTGRPRKDAERFLATFGLQELFAVVVAMEDGPAKPDPFPVRLALERLGVERAWMVGDTPDDMQAARAVGVLPIGFSAQQPTAETELALLRSGAARVLNSLTPLAGSLRRDRCGELKR